eukprot:GFUD01028708.1.p1 GENE.GFUD01028708.1~~GFUD01028708.1.p1  ORF type:complete len:1182 (+),score=227.13 GFUD01028708.1:55-3600(+)
MSLTGSELTSGLQTRLSSSLPLPARCRLAVNSFTSKVFIPSKEQVVLDWLLTSLDLKYTERLSTTPTTDDTLLWDTLQTCLSHLTVCPPSPPYKFSTVPDLLLNILPHIDLSLTPVMTCVSSLLSLSSNHTPDHPNWSNLLSRIIPFITDTTNDLLISSLHKVVEKMTPDPTLDHSPLVTQLSELYLTHPHPSLQRLVTPLLFPSPDPYTPLFSHLAGVEGKYHPGQVTSVLLSSLSQGCSPLLILASCPDQPTWLKSRLFSLLLSTQGCTGLVDSSTVEGGKLMMCLKKRSRFEGHKLFKLALPLDLAVDIMPGYNVAKNVQDVVKELVIAEGVTEVIAEIIEVVHTHHPQLLEPVVALILEQYLGKPEASSEVFGKLVDVLLKMRQLPKMISKLFLQLRSSEIGLEWSWSESDMIIFGSALGSLPRVQSLEMWKTLNYHFSTDILGSECVPAKADNVARVLSPLLSTVLSHSQLADHNLPSSLLPRIQDLTETTLTNLETMFAKEELSSAFKTLLIEATSVLSDLSRLFVEYRGLKQFESVAAFSQKLVARIVDNSDWQDLPLARKFMLRFGSGDKNSEKIYAKIEDTMKELELLPNIIDQIPGEILIKAVRKTPIKSGSLLENPRYCSAVVFVLLDKMNKQENFYIPGFDQWRNQNDLSSLESYLGKSLASCFTTLLHAEMPGSELSLEDLDLLGKLPLEYLPSVLKLGATLICLSQVFRKSGVKTSCFRLVARCLETTDLFRFVDAGRFLNQILVLDGVTDELIEVVAKSAGRFSKTIKDIELSFQQFEDNFQNENNLHLKASVCLLNSLSKSLNEGAEGTDKKIAGKALADRISKHVVKIFKQKNLDNEEQINLLCEAAAEIVKLYSKTGLGKMSKLVHKMVELTFSENCKAWKYLLEEVCHHLEHFETEMLPENWKLSAWEALAGRLDEDSQPLLRSLVKIADSSELEQMLQILLKDDLLDLKLWETIISSEVIESSSVAKKAGIEQAVTKICKLLRTPDYAQLDRLPAFLNSVFSSSPPCVSTQLEIVCLGSLLFAPKESAPSSLTSLSTFLSHRGTLSTRTIPITTSLIRHFISPPPSIPTLQALQKVLGLFSRHKADYSSVLPYLLADLLHLLSSLPPQSKSILTTSLYPLLDMLDKHSFEYLSSNLPPATNENFKQTLAIYNASHKFKGKV